MRQARRREPHLRVAKTLAHLAQHIGGGHPQVVELDHAMATREAAVHRLHLANDANAGPIHVGKEHGGRAVIRPRHDDRVRRTVSAGDQPFHSIDHVVVAVAHRGGREHGRVGSGTGGGLGHGKAGARATLDLRPQPALLLRGRRDHFHEVNVAFVRSVDVERGRPERRVSGFLEHDRFGDVAETEPAHVARGVRRQQACTAGLRDQLVTQLLARTVTRLARVVFHREHLLDDEAARAIAQFEQIRG